MEWSVQSGAAGRSILHSLFISCFISNIYLSLHLSFIHSDLLPLSSSMILASFLPFPTFLSIHQGLPPFVLALFASAVVFFYCLLFSLSWPLSLWPSSFICLCSHQVISPLNSAKRLEANSFIKCKSLRRRKISSTTRSWDPRSLFPSLSCSFWDISCLFPPYFTLPPTFIQSLYRSVSCPQVSLLSQFLPCCFYPFMESVVLLFPSF